MDTMVRSFGVRADESNRWITQLFEANVGAAFNVAYRITWSRADALDVVQDAFIKAMRRADQLREPAKERSWLLAITYREALSMLRSRRDVATDPSDFDGLSGRAEDPADVVARHELAALIDAAIMRLAEPLRTAFVLRDVEELPIADVAEILGIGLSASKMRVARAREQLRVALEGVI
jgi:RNA polymerase sigma-70 factor (ECF subfamily)